MTHPSSTPGFDLKHRVTGAIILIGFGVVVLPWILRGPVPQSPDVDRGVPAPAHPTRVFVSKITPITGSTPLVEAVTEEDAPPAEPTQAPPRTSKPVAVTTARPAAPAKPAAKKAQPSVDQGWIVQVGTFADRANSERVLADLRKAGFEPATSTVKTNKGEALRVWVGPFAQRVQAARVRTRIEQTLGYNGLITAYP